MILVYGVAGIGKALRTDQPVLTPTGWRPIGELKPGDDVMTPSGESTKIKYVFPQGEKELFELKTTLGGSVICCGEHLWTTSERSKGHRFETVVTTDHIRKTLHSGGWRKEINHRLPSIKPQLFNQIDPEVDPYVLGAWLGDGTKKTTSLTNPEESIFEEVKRRAPCATKESSNTLTISLKDAGFRSYLRSSELFELGSHERFIPKECLVASIEFRSKLLQGLMDTDGWTTDGMAGYSTSSSRLADDLQFLVCSLGGYARRHLKTGVGYKDGNGNFIECRDAHVMAISLPDELDFPFYASVHKREGYGKPQNQARYRTHYIESVEPVGKGDAVCIAIEHPSAMFVTKDFIPTHNSSFASQAPSPLFVDMENGLSRIDCARTPSIKSWESLKEAMTFAAKSEEFKTIVFDSIDALEQIIVQKVLEDDGTKKQSLADFGYGRGYELLAATTGLFVGMCDKLKFDYGKNIILIGHDKIKKFEDPASDSYDRYQLNMHEKSAAMLIGRCDAVLFARWETHTKSRADSMNKDKKRAIGTGRRVLFTEETPAWVAKNRFSLPPEVELSSEIFQLMK